MVNSITYASKVRVVQKSTALDTVGIFTNAERGGWISIVYFWSIFTFLLAELIHFIISLHSIYQQINKMTHDTDIFTWKPNMGENHKIFGSCKNNYIGSTNFQVLLHQQEGGYNPLNLSEHQLTLAPPCHPDLFICIFHGINHYYWSLHIIVTDHSLSMLLCTISLQHRQNN